MSSQLNGKKILIITSNTGIERDELLKPLQALRDFGATVTHGYSKGGTTQTFVGDTEKDKTVESDVQLSDVVSRDFDALVILIFVPLLGLIAWAMFGPKREMPEHRKS